MPDVHSDVSAASDTERAAWFWARVSRTERIAAPLSRLVSELDGAGESTARLYAEAARRNLVRTASILAVAAERMQGPPPISPEDDVLDALLVEWLEDDGSVH